MRRELMRRHDEVVRSMYRRGHPNALARALNGATALLASAGLWPRRLVTLEVRGRRSGRIIRSPMVVADYEGDRYLVAMLGQHAQWARNVRAADGHAVLCHGRRESVHLEEIDALARAPIILRYLTLAPGAGPHSPVDRHAPIQDVQQIAAQIPVFRVVLDDSSSHTPADTQTARARARV